MKRFHQPPLYYRCHSFYMIFICRKKHYYRLSNHNLIQSYKVTVKGFALADIVVKYGDDGSDDYAALASVGAFFDATTERIFEESGKGILASL